MTEPFMLFHHEISEGVLTCYLTGEAAPRPHWFNVGRTRITTSSSSSYTIVFLESGETQLAQTTIPNDQHDGLWSCRSAENDIIHGLIGLYTYTSEGGNSFHACKIRNT